jgi:hypothetical protein
VEENLADTMFRGIIPCVSIQHYRGWVYRVSYTWASGCTRPYGPLTHIYTSNPVNLSMSLKHSASIGCIPARSFPNAFQAYMYITRTHAEFHITYSSMMFLSP